MRNKLLLGLAAILVPGGIPIGVAVWYLRRRRTRQAREQLIAELRSLAITTRCYVEERTAKRGAA